MPTDRLFGPYRLEHLLGRGGMGEVWRAYDTTHHRTVALKLLLDSLSTDPEYQARFEREARIAANLHEQHIIPIHRYGQINGQLFIDMRYVDGEDLSRLLRRTGPLEPRRAVGIIEQVAAALDAAHAAGLVHRDVKPANVLIATTRPGTTDSVYLADFGIARIGNTNSSSSRLTATGAAVGTPDYMAPERLTSGVVDHRADIYALGCLLYEILTGEKPFVAEDHFAVLYQHVEQPPPRATDKRPDLPPAIDGVIAMSMAKEPVARHATAGHLAAAARRAIDSSGPPVRAAAPRGGGGVRADVSARPATPDRRQQGRRRPGRRELIGGGVAVALLAAVAVALVVIAPWRTPTKPAEQAARPFTASLSIKSTVAVGKGPTNLVLSPDGRRVFVANTNSRNGQNINTTENGSVTVIDTASDLVITTIPVGRWPTGLAVTPDGRRLYVVNSLSETVSMIDTGTYAVAGSIHVTRAVDIAVTHDGRFAYIANDSEHLVTVINTADNSVAATIPVGPTADGRLVRAESITLATDARRAYVTDSQSDTVAVIDTSTNAQIATIAVGHFPYAFAGAPNGRTAYVIGSDSVSVIDTAGNTVTRQFRVPKGRDLGGGLTAAFAPDGRFALVTTFGSDGGVSAIDPNRDVTTSSVVIGGELRRIVITADGTRCYVSNAVADTVLVISTGR